MTVIRLISRIMCVLATWPRWLLLSMSVVLIVLFGLLDYATGPQVNVLVLFLIPIVPIAWLFGMRWAAPVAVSAGLVMYMASTSAGVEYATPLIPLWNFGSRFVVVMLVARAIVYLHQTALKAESLAQTDALTGIGNVRYFRAAAAREISRSQRYGHPFTTAFIDVDNFKQVNDTFGHEAGDRTLRAIGQALASQVRETDLVARVGGDEFILLLPMMSGEHASPFLEGLRERLRQHLEDVPAPLTCSIGVVTFETPPASVDEILQLTDERRYVAKQGGKDTIRHRVISRLPERAFADRALA